MALAFMPGEGPRVAGEGEGGVAARLDDTLDEKLRGLPTGRNT